MLFCFNPRSPCGERCISSSCVVCPVKFQSTLPLRGATVKTTTPITTFELFQSTLPLRGATCLTQKILARKQFQSTLPLRGATICPGRTDRSNHNFNPRSPCGERPQTNLLNLANNTFQSTLPLWGATRNVLLRCIWLRISIHAPPVGSDRWGQPDQACPAISIHAPPVGSDQGPAKSVSRVSYFNPRSPCGERLCMKFAGKAFVKFQSTLPLWGATSA